MKRFVTAIALSVLLSASALAGDVPSVGVPAPGPSGMTQTTTGDISTVPGDIPSGGLAEQVSDAALSGLLAVFGLLSV
jgi:hypothetical protein